MASETPTSTGQSNTPRILVPEAVTPSPDGLEAPARPPEVREPLEEDPRRAPGWRRAATKVVHFVPAIFLFILAIQLMKAGANALRPYLEGTFPFDNALSTLGLGWIGAYFVLSGSPVAAVSLALFAAGALSRLQTFTMLSGSRLGASFIVLLVGFLYAVKSKNRRESMGMGVLALSLTAIVYVPGMFLGYGLLKTGFLSGVKWTASSEVQGLIDLGWSWIVDPARNALPGGVLFPLGLLAILLSFRLLDRVLPQIDGHRAAEGKQHWLKKPWPMFFLGCLAALLTLSVSVAITVLVPLAAKGYVDRKEAMPYIMGANITTLADTLVAAMLLGRPDGVQVVLSEAIAVALVTIVALLFFYPALQRMVMALDEWVVSSNKRLAIFVTGLFVLPAILLLSGRILGPITQ